MNDGKYGLLIRPENVHVREEGFEAKVLTVSFTGERYQYTADVNDMTVMFYSQQLYHVAETIKLQFDTPANYFIKMEETLMIKFGKWIAIVLSMVVILTACQNKSEESNEESKSEGGKKSDKLVLLCCGT